MQFDSFDPNAVTMLTGVTRVTLLQWLVDAQAAYAQLAIGGKPVSVSYDGKSVTYAVADRAALQMWISQLQRQLGIGGGRRAIRPIFR